MIRKGGSSIFNLIFTSTVQQRKMSSRPAGPIFFGSFEVTPQVFLTTQHSFALVNLKPLLPGHVLICPRQPHKRLTDLAAAELTDLFQAVQRVQRMLARHYFYQESAAAAAAAAQASDSSSSSSVDGGGVPEAGSFNIAIQDGVEAGQTVPHLHVHVIPRIRGATAKEGSGPGDRIYQLMAAEEGNVGGALWDRELKKLRTKFGDRPEAGGEFESIEDSERHARSAEEMAAEANMFRGVLEQMGEAEGKSG
ncbi:HIT-like protein [Annulohypoxylon truncatum]|uniref:HIT-like protein n=1 Tax=Annulohypoxylon truncatum TaxID=327061 RepID=UPI0020089725|nr:HIT-like protein [Annulohypoxylon truncatum]KAI1209928.1 HIT-like protein [Annulohypoxylon truncatum]